MSFSLPPWLLPFWSSLNLHWLLRMTHKMWDKHLLHFLCRPASRNVDLRYFVLEHLLCNITRDLFCLERLANLTEICILCFFALFLQSLFCPPGRIDTIPCCWKAPIWPTQKNKTGPANSQRKAAGRLRRLLHAEPTPSVSQVVPASQRCRTMFLARSYLVHKAYAMFPLSCTSVLNKPFHQVHELRVISDHRSRSGADLVWRSDRCLLFAGSTSTHGRMQADLVNDRRLLAHFEKGCKLRLGNNDHL